jgi:hypothetical protein
MTPYKLGDVVVARRRVYYPQLAADIEIGEEWPLVVLHEEAPGLSPGHSDIRVAPLCDAIRMATHRDLLCNSEDGPLGVPFMVEVWNQRPMLVRNIDRAIGRMSVDAIELLCKLHNATIGLHPWEAIPPERHGTAITSADDPRLEHQRKRILKAAFLSEPVDELLDARAEAGIPDQYSVFVSFAFNQFAGAMNKIILYNHEDEAKGWLEKANDLVRSVMGPHLPNWGEATGEYPVVSPLTARFVGEPTPPPFSHLHIRRHLLGFDVSGRMSLDHLPQCRVSDDDVFAWIDESTGSSSLPR